MVLKARGCRLPIALIPGFLTLVLAAQAGSAATPKLLGQWKITWYACVTYESVLEINAPPQFDSGSAVDVLMVITRQKGAVFSGYFAGFEGEGDKQLLTGVINSDNSVSIQFAGHNYRSLFTGRYLVEGTKKLIKGTYAEFEEYLASKPSISSGYLELEKK